MATGHGIGIRLDRGDIVLADGDIALVSGLPNLAQALQLRVLTPLGSDRYDTRYGFDYRAVFTTPAGAYEMRDLVRLNLVRTISTDQRVREIRDIDVLDAQVDPHHRKWNVEVSIIAGDGTAATLTTELGAAA
ncbi:hypothetical protein [Nocardia iowensis]|uniref:DUF2634 domain-containing protein n=1 Tax=Nocardia iowensis TaxID=204891 RepID=A0ABX8RHB0_NOCIO|nr:hypothetical protein [Nocardia iowensis]QXN88277.1 hypothetical protein KV110_21985 [Nocardia iowensis]